MGSANKGGPMQTRGRTMYLAEEATVLFVSILSHEDRCVEEGHRWLRVWASETISV